MFTLDQIKNRPEVKIILEKKNHFRIVKVSTSLRRYNFLYEYTSIKSLKHRKGKKYREEEKADIITEKYLTYLSETDRIAMKIAITNMVYGSRSVDRG